MNAYTTCSIFYSKPPHFLNKLKKSERESSLPNLDLGSNFQENQLIKNASNDRLLKERMCHLIISHSFTIHYGG